MRKVVSRVSAIALAAAMMAVSAVPAFAAGIGTGTVQNGVNSDASVTIPKGITNLNDEPGTYYGPDVTYSYSIAPVEPAASASVTDSNNRTQPVHQGPADGASLASTNVTFTSGTVSVIAGGTEITQNLTVNVDTTKFASPGIYRYVITDTTSAATLYAAGITRPDNYDTTRYLDVYIRNGNNGLEVAGYALTKDNMVSIVANTTKDPGFIASSETATGAPGTDRYKTYNVTLTKSITGDMADKTHAFPFSVTVSNQGRNCTYNKNSETQTTATDPTFTVNLTDTDVLYIKGLSPKATVAYTETNDTEDNYVVTIAGTGNGSTDTFTNNGTLNAGDTASLTAGAVSSYNTANSASSVANIGADTTRKAVTFTNNLESISPTGVIIRIAPFALLLALAMGLFLATRKRKNDETRDI